MITVCSASLADTLRTLCGPEVVCESASAQLVTQQLYPLERQYIARAVESRQAQFGTARVCARRALAQLGIAPCSLVPNDDRSPRWPPGVRGSIAHTDHYCAAAVTCAASVRGLGIDLECDGPVTPGLERVICTSRENAWIKQVSGEASAWLIPLVFSAKEAFYKCQYPMTGARLGFEDVELNIDVDAGTFTIAELRADVPERARVLRIVGRFRHLPSLIVTSALLEE